MFSHPLLDQALSRIIQCPHRTVFRIINPELQERKLKVDIRLQEQRLIGNSQPFEKHWRG